MHARPIGWALAVTGGGSQAIADLLAVPGASASILEALVPYADRAVDRLLGARPERYCCDAAARALAMAAFMRAQSLVDHEPAAAVERPDPSTVRPTAGVGATASLASLRPKRGPHRLHVAVQTLDATETLAVEFAKGARSRRAEERLAADLILDLMARCADVDPRPPLDLRPDEPVARRRTAARPAWRRLLSGASRVERAAPDAPTHDEQAHDEPPHDEQAGVEGRRGRAIMPGAYNPRHAGHRQMQAAAAERLGRPVELEISLWNVDKPPLDYQEIERRVAQFEPLETVWLTRAPTFLEKARLFPEAWFVVGADTAVRIGLPKYYGDDVRRRDAALDELTASGCRFLVFGRQSENRFLTLDELDLPPALRALCEGVSEREFRIDLSSTELRRQAAGEA